MHDDRQPALPAHAPDPLMASEQVLDVRNLEPPEPFVLVMEALDRLGPGERLAVLIDRRPGPLYRALDQNGFAFREAPGKEALLEITIWRKD